jgi:hypothetical protein
MSRAQLLVLIAVVVLLGGAAVYAVGGRLPWIASSSACDIPESVTGEQAPAAGIRVVEQGFSQSAVDGSVSLGALLENTATSVAYRTRVTFRLFDATHQSLPEAAPSPAGLTAEIPIMLPGQRIGVADDTHPAGNAKVASFAVEPGTTTWISRETLGRFAPVTATYLRTGRPNPNSNQSIAVYYRESSTNCRSLNNKNAAALFRDAGGAIVGGALVSPGGLFVFRDDRGQAVGGEQTLPSSPSCEQGERETWLVPLVPAPATAADARTEIYPYCDLPRPG